MYKKSIIYGLLLSVGIAFSSCYKLIDDDLDDYPQQLVLTGMLEAGKRPYVYVSLSGSLNDTALIKVDEAVVTLTCQSDNRMITMQPYYLADSMPTGWYTASDTVRSGETYICKATLDNYDNLQKTVTVPYPPDLQTVQTAPAISKDKDGHYIRKVIVSFVDNKQQLHYYELRVNQMQYTYDTNEDWELIISDSCWKSTSFSLDPKSNVIFQHEASPISLFGNRNMPNDTCRISFGCYYTSFANGEPMPDRRQVELRAVSEEYYRYFKQLEVEVYHQDGALGAFSAVNVEIEI